MFGPDIGIFLTMIWYVILRFPYTRRYRRIKRQFWLGRICLECDGEQFVIDPCSFRLSLNFVELGGPGKVGNGSGKG